MKRYQLVGFSVVLAFNLGFFFKELVSVGTAIPDTPHFLRNIPTTNGTVRISNITVKTMNDTTNSKKQAATPNQQPAVTSTNKQSAVSLQSKVAKEPAVKAMFWLNECHHQCEVKKCESSPDCCQAALEKALIYLKDYLEKHDIEHSWVFGTHLGAYRDKQIMPWTLDLDVAMGLAGMEYIWSQRKILYDEGYSVFKGTDAPGTCVTRMCFNQNFWKQLPAYNSNRIPLKRGRLVYIDILRSNKENDVCGRTMFNLFDGTQTIRTSDGNNVTIRVPGEDPEVLLERIYGPGWGVRAKTRAMVGPWNDPFNTLNCNYSAAIPNAHLSGYACGDSTFYKKLSHAEYMCCECPECGGITVSIRNRSTIRASTEIRHSGTEISYLKQ